MHPSPIALLSFRPCYTAEKKRLYGRALAVIATQVVHPKEAWETVGWRPSATQAEARMNIHKNARITPYSRLLMARRVAAGESAVSVAADFYVSEQTVRKWVRRWRSGGEIALLDRSSKPVR